MFNPKKMIPALTAGAFAQSFVDRLNEVNQQLSDRVAEALRAVMHGQQERRKALDALRRRARAENAEPES